MRLFTGIALSDEVRQNLGRLVRSLKPAARIKWIRPENLHITTKYIGEWPEERLEELKEALVEVAAPGAIPVAVRGLGWFPDPHSPRVFWAGIEAPDELAELARAIDRQLQPLGIEPETRRFSPHLTLARIRSQENLDGLRRAIERLPANDFGSFTADRFHLFSSDLQPSGAVYTSIAEYLLGES